MFYIVLSRFLSLLLGNKMVLKTNSKSNPNPKEEMMKAQKTCLLVFAVAVCLAAGSMLFATAANAELEFVESGGVLLTFDNATNLWWQQDPSRHGGSFVDATASVGLDNTNQYGLVNTWAIASEAQMNELFENFDRLAGPEGTSMCDPQLPDCFFEQTATVPCPVDICEGEYFRVWEGWSATTEGPDDIRVGVLINYKGQSEPDFWDESVVPVDSQDSVGGSWVVSSVGPVEDDCTGDDDCDDQLYCNGEETCADGQCEDGTAPCGEGEICDEETDSCKLPCACDLNNDGVCNYQDWLEFIQDWRRADCPRQ
jgi:hypothetical protein